MNIKEKQKEIFDHWISKNIVIHQRLTNGMLADINWILRDYTVDEIKVFIDFYAQILEPGVVEKDKKYFWSYKWGLGEFLRRGVKKFDGQSPDNYLKKQKVQAPEAVIFTRNK